MGVCFFNLVGALWYHIVKLVVNLWSRVRVKVSIHVALNFEKQSRTLFIWFKIIIESGWRWIIIAKILISHCYFEIPIDFTILIVMILSIWRGTLVIMTIKKWITQLTVLIINIIISKPNLQWARLVTIVIFASLISIFYFTFAQDCYYLIDDINKYYSNEPKDSWMLLILRFM